MTLFFRRLVTYIAGMGVEVWNAGDNFFWIPLVMPHIGAVLGAVVYYIGIEFLHKDKPMLD